jgi:hypothetical protein
MKRHVRGFRRTGAALAVWAVVMALLAVLHPGAASGSFEAGQGSAIAQGIRVDPRNGQLSFGIKLALSLADHINERARAESRSIDLGVIGTTLAAESCSGGEPTYRHEDQPQPVRVTNTDQNSEDGRTESEFGVIEKHADASDAPLGHSETTAAPFTIPGALQVGAIRSESTSGVVDGRYREAKAVAEVDSINFANGQAVLRGLRWEAVVRTGGETLREGTFSIASGQIGGTPIAGITGNAIQGITALNAALEPLGFQLAPPRERLAGDVLFLEPLRISIIPSDLRDTVTGGVLNEAQPAREELFNRMIAANCSSASFVTIADLVLGSVSGAGSLGLELGGVQATSGTVNLSNNLGDIPEWTPPPMQQPPTTVATPGQAAVPGTPGSPPRYVEDSFDDALGDAARTAADDTGDAGEDESAAPSGPSAAQPIANRIGTRGGAMAGVGLAGLLTVLALAEADRRRLRRASRTMSEVTA